MTELDDEIAAWRRMGNEAWARGKKEKSAACHDRARELEARRETCVAPLPGCTCAECRKPRVAVVAEEIPDAYGRTSGITAKSYCSGCGTLLASGESCYVVWCRTRAVVVAKEIITYAALLVNGEVWMLPRPARHHTLVHAWASAHYKDGANGCIPNDHEQGFVTSHGRFVNREKAARIAHFAGQIETQKAELFSEDLW